MFVYGQKSNIFYNKEIQLLLQYRRRLITEENNYDYFKSFIVCEIT